jgi:hypothetical protein
MKLNNLIFAFQSSTKFTMTLCILYPVICIPPEIIPDAWMENNISQQKHFIKTIPFPKFRGGIFYS